MARQQCATLVPFHSGSSLSLWPQFVNQMHMKPESARGPQTPIILIVVFAMILSRCTDLGHGPPQVIQPPPNEDPIPTDKYSTWSPDGRRIAYSHISVDLYDTTYPTGLYVIDTSGNNGRLVIAGSAFCPDWFMDCICKCFNMQDNG